jgi:hypothetical protein
MKKLYLVLFLIILVGNKAVSQDTRNVRAIAFAAAKMNVVYANIENPITIVASGIPTDKIKVISDKGTLTGGNGNYSIFVPDPKTENIKEITLTVFYESVAGEQNVLSKQVFRVKIVPKPVVYFGDKVSGEISKEEINAVDSLQVNMYDFNYQGLQYTIKKFKLIYVPKKGNAQPFEANNGFLTPDMKAAIKNPITGDVIMVYDIFVTFLGSSEIRLPASLSLNVK